MVELKFITEPGAIALGGTVGAALGAIIGSPNAGAIVCGVLALVGVAMRCATEIWRTKRRDRERIDKLKARLEAANLSTDTNTEDQ